jgi:hypothetical protein
LCRLIEEADTPFVIGIHGEWGSGKTSLMKLIEARFSENSLWFDSWEYGREDRIWVSLILRLIDAVADEREKISWLRKLAQIAADVGIQWLTKGNTSWLQLARKAKETREGEDFISMIDDEEFKSWSRRTITIASFKSQFETLLRKKIQAMGKDRFIIFIDDLDRCAPEKVIGFLEDLKIFLELKGCVFVIGFDYGVIERGLRARYAQLLTSSQAYFDKIIQFTFRIPPVTDERLTDYMNHVNLPNQPIYCNLISASIQRNPRAIKRISYQYHFLGLLEPTIKDAVLFKLFCLQQRWEALYSLLLRKHLQGEDAFKNLSENIKKLKTRLTESERISEEEIETIRIFSELPPSFPAQSEIDPYVTMVARIISPIPKKKTKKVIKRPVEDEAESLSKEEKEEQDAMDELIDSLLTPINSEDVDDPLASPEGFRCPVCKSHLPRDAKECGDCGTLFDED